MENKSQRSLGPICHAHVIVFRENARDYQSAFFGRGTGVIYLDDVQCEGDEPNLSYCDHHVWPEENCSHGEDVGVSCHCKSPKKYMKQEDYHSVWSRRYYIP